jgi:hypothetical protein
MLSVMGDEKPNPLDDVRKGLGLLFRAARTAAEKLPTKDLEEVVVTSAREVGRALENVGRTLEREVFGKKDEPPAREKPHGEEPQHDEENPPASSPPPDEPKPPDAA